MRNNLLNLFHSIFLGLDFEGKVCKLWLREERWQWFSRKMKKKKILGYENWWVVWLFDVLEALIIWCWFFRGFLMMKKTFLNCTVKLPWLESLRKYWGFTVCWKIHRMGFLLIQKVSQMESNLDTIPDTIR